MFEHQLSPFPSYYHDQAEDYPLQDKFHRQNFAQQIADTIANKEDENNIVIGVHGAWGTGKTTVLRFIRNRLETQHKQKIITIDFNPWRYNDEDKLLIGFFDKISNTLNLPLVRWDEKVGKFATMIGSIIGWFMGEGYGKIIQLIGLTLSTTEVRKFKDRVIEHLKEKRRHIVIFIDDIDRLDKAEIQAVFRLVKLTADFPYTTYILAFDENIVADVLAEQYLSTKNDNYGYSFLEKIVQVPIYLPQIDESDLDSYIESKIIEVLHQTNIELTPEDLNLFFNYYRKSLKRRLKTPRTAKLFANTLLFALPVLRDEVNVVDLMLLQGLRVFYPKVYDFVQSHRSLFLGEDMSQYISEIAQDVQPTILGIRIREKLKDDEFKLTNDEHDAIIDLLIFLFPHLEGSFFNFQIDEQLIKENRVASRYHWNRYFSYGLVSNELSETQLTNFIEDIEKLTTNEITLKIQELVKFSNGREFVGKLQGKAGELQEATAKKLALVIAPIGEVFEETNKTPQASYFSQAPSLIRELLSKIPLSNDQRFNVAKIILENAQPVYFSYECYLQMRTAQYNRQQELFSDEAEKKLGTILAKYIKHYVETTSLLEDNNIRLLKLLSIWARFSGRDETNEYLTNIVRKEPKIALHISKLALPYGNLSTESDPRFDSDAYKLITSFIDADVIAEGLISLNIPELDTPQDDSPYQDLEKIATHQFLRVHRNITTK